MGGKFLVRKETQQAFKFIQKQIFETLFTRKSSASEGRINLSFSPKFSSFSLSSLSVCFDPFVWCY